MLTTAGGALGLKHRFWRARTVKTGWHMTPPQALIKQTLNLPEPARIVLARMLLESISSVSEEDWDEAWFQELEVRVQRHDGQPQRLIKWTDVRNEILADLDRP